MNLAAHLRVAVDLGAAPGSDERLGAVLPDLASMVGLRARPDGLPAGVRRGLTLHHRADEAFHGSAWFVAATTADRQALEAAGVPRGPARACAHVGVELLLDGVLLEDRSLGASLRSTVGGLDPDRLGERDPQRRAAWSSFAARLSGVDPAALYPSPAVVADRLARTLGHRPRLRLEDRWLPAVVEVLEARRPAVAEVAPSLVATVTAAVADAVAASAGCPPPAPRA